MKDSIQKISELVYRKSRMDLSMYDASFLKKSIEKRIQEAQCVSIGEYYHLLEKEPTEISCLLESMENSYTEFFRNSLTFSVLEKVLLPSLFLGTSDDKELRIWSSACASGQEIYSLAMLLQELQPKKNVAVRIFATDTLEREIEFAQKGHYPDAALKNVSLDRLGRWFLKTGSGYTIKPELKENIEFTVYDLLDKKTSSPPSSIFGGFDIVFCANVLFYYNAESQKKIIQKIRKNTSEHGYIITGEAEREILLHHRFHEVYPHSAIFRK